MQANQIVVGADPELFMVDADNHFISSVGKIGGSKDHPMPIDDEGCAIQEDNVAVEYNIPACASAADFIKYNRKVIEDIRERAARMGLSLAIVPSAVFSPDELMSPQAAEFGCEPDFNAWKDGSQNPRPRAEDPALRSAGGHIHIGNISDLDPLAVIQAMDLFVGCQMLKFDNDKRRRELYGKAGAFRPKKYGVEYRTASNAWIQSDETIRWAFEQTEKAVAFVREGRSIKEAQGLMIQDCINNSDMGLLEAINTEFGL